MKPMKAERIIWRGPLLGNQRQELLKEVKACIRSGAHRSGGQVGHYRVIYLVASRPMLNAIALEILDGQTLTGLFDGLPVYLFNGFIRRLLRTARVKHKENGWQRLAFRRDISGEDYPLRRPLIAQLMRQLARCGKLSAFGELATARGCVASVARLIGEITRAGKTAAEFTDIVERRITRFKESFPAPLSPQSAEQAYGYEQDVARIMRCYATALNGGNNNLRHHQAEQNSTAPREQFTERDTDYLRAIAALDGELDGLPCQTPLLDGVEWLIVDGFFDLTPVQGEILRRLIERVPRVTFNFDDDTDNPSVFAAVHETIAKIRDMMGDGCQEVIFQERAGSQLVTHLPTSSGLNILRRGLFNRAFTPLPDLKAPVFLAVAPDIERELRYIAKTIKHHIHKCQRSPSEIAIVLRDKDTYGLHLRRVLSDEGIAYALDERLPVTDIPAVRAWLKLVAAAADRPRGETTPDHIPVSRLIAILKSDYFTISGHQMSVDDIENVVAFVGEQLHLTNWLQRAGHLKDAFQLTTGDQPPTAETDLEAGESGDLAAEEPMVRPDNVTAAQLQEVSHGLQQLGNCLAEIPTEGTAIELCAAIEQALRKLNYEAQLEANIRKTIGQPRQRLQATLDLRGLQIIRRATAAVADAERLASQSIAATLDKETAPSSGEPTRMTLAVFLSDVLQALDELTLRVEPEMFGAVRILEATAIRGLHFPIIFVPGLVEGSFPLRLPGDWLYPPAEREQLKREGLVLEDISPSTIVKEEHYFYQVVCRATEAVYLSYPTANAEDQELIPSSFLAEIQRLVPATLPGHEHHTLVPRGYDGETFLTATTRHELVRQTTAIDGRLRRGWVNRLPFLEPNQTVQAQRTNHQVLSLTEQLSAVKNYIQKQNWKSETLQGRQQAEESRYSGHWTAFDGCIQDVTLQNKLNERFGEQYIFSATAFNEYASCPFRFFAHRVLQLRPRVSAAVDLHVIERGRILHDVLRNFYRAVSSSGFNKDPECQLDLLKKTANEIFNQYEQRIPPLNTKLWEIEKRILLTYLEQIIREELSASIKPVQRITELAFGMSPTEAHESSVKESLELTNDRKQRILLRGQIDRIDIIKLKDEGSKNQACIIYDYKLSKGTPVSDMLKGLDVQIAVYLASIEKFPDLPKNIIGAGYYSLTQIPRRSNGLYRSDMEEFLEKDQKSNLFSKEEFKSKFESIINHIWKYNESIKKGNFQAYPSRGIIECQFCDFKFICRYEKYRAKGKSS
ncbi:MAG: PD-(D/E)XK nuclease family protein [Acidobacteriota bacterium]